MLAPLRLYIKLGCPHCRSAVNFLVAKRVPFEVIDIGYDPIIQRGIAAYYGTMQGIAPILVAEAVKQDLTGFNAQEYERVCNSYLAIIRPEPSRSASAGSNHLEQAEGLDSPPKPPTQ